MLIVLLLTLSITISFCLFNDGLGIEKEQGSYVLQQGKAYRDIDQTLGAVYYWTSKSVLIFAALAIPVAVVVYSRNGSINPNRLVTANGEASLCLVVLLRVGLLSLVIPWLIGMGKLVQRIFLQSE
jgi:hypothetical protein